MIFELLRFVIRLILNLFFREIKVRGFHNIPNEGPVLFAVAPHANQFVDPLMILVTSGRKVGFLAAKKSMDKFFIGILARLFNSIPVQRPQDLIKKANGQIHMSKDDPLLIHGLDTKFTSLTVKATIVLPKGAGEAVIDKIVSDSELILKSPFVEDSATTLLTAVDEDGKRSGTEWSVIPNVDQSGMFQAVISRLSKDQAVGIFPEGGSHDRPEMLPLKAGVSIMALETLAKYPGTKLKIIPTGLHYFNCDKFRSRAVLEYGEAIDIPVELVDQFKLGGPEKRKAISLLLDTIQIRLKTLTLQAPDFDSLMVAQASRRLYQPERLDADSALLISRRFAEAYEKLKDDVRVKVLTQEVLKYNRMLLFYGVRDHQVKNTKIDIRIAAFRILSRSLQIAFVIVICTPVIILMAPLFFMTRRVSHEKMKEAMAGSKVKISGKDVVTTWKLLTALVVAPFLWLLYTFLCFLYFYSYYDYSTGVAVATLFSIFWPIISALAIHLGDLANDLSVSIRPLIVSIGNTLSSSEPPLREMRAELQIKIRRLVEECGPEIFQDFDKVRVVSKKVLDAESFNLVAAEKLGRGKNIAVEMFEEESIHINTVFGKEVDKVEV